MKKRVFLVSLLLCILLFFMVWGISVVHCEVLTHKHGYEFEDKWMQNTMLSSPAYLKVLEYSDATAVVYYVAENNAGGDTLTFSRSGPTDSWVFVSWETNWSKTGSADGYIWPYGR